MHSNARTLESHKLHSSLMITHTSLRVLGDLLLSVLPLTASALALLFYPVNYFLYVTIVDEFLVSAIVLHARACVVIRLSPAIMPLAFLWVTEDRDLVLCQKCWTVDPSPRKQSLERVRSRRCETGPGVP